MLKLYKHFKKGLLVFMAIVCNNNAYAAISLDRTRIVFNGGDKNLPLNITNDNKQLPYLAQSWIDNEKGEKLATGPLVVTPPVQRLNPGEKSIVLLTATPDITKLPQDRETVYYFNLREIPPKSDKANVLQIALHTRIKLFYRPAALKNDSGKVWQKDIILNKVDGGYEIENPTPYYVTIIGIGNNEAEIKAGKFEAIMLSPKSTETVKSAHFSNPRVSWIDDFGGRPIVTFNCSGNRCTTEND